MTRAPISVAILFAAFVFLHLPVEDVFDWFAARYGFEAYDRVTFGVFAVSAIGLLAAAWLWPSPRRVLIGSSATALVALAAIVHRLLVVVSVENIHYPQYALLAGAVAYVAPNLEIAWLVTVALGIVDEAFQFAALTRGTPPYFDWNDIVLNAIGASLGVVVLLAINRGHIVRHFTWRAMAAAAFVLTAAAVIVDPPILSPFFTLTPFGRSFHKLSATEAAIVVVGLWTWVRASASAPNLPAK